MGTWYCESRICGGTVPIGIRPSHKWEGELRVYMRLKTINSEVQARLAWMRELQSQTQEELDALLPSVLDRAFKGELWPPSRPSPKSIVRI